MLDADRRIFPLRRSQTHPPPEGRGGHRHQGEEDAGKGAAFFVLLELSLLILTFTHFFLLSIMSQEK
jgi:hypothetical protein